MNEAIERALMVGKPAFFLRHSTSQVPLVICKKGYEAELLDLLHEKSVVELMRPKKEMSRENVLHYFGWTIECESPFEIRYEDGSSVATGEAADIVMKHCYDNLEKAGEVK